MHEESYKKISEHLWQIILILLGMLMLLISFFVEKEPGKFFATFNGIGVSLLLSGILGIFMNVLFYRKDAKYKVCEEWKINNIYASRAIAK